MEQTEITFWIAGEEIPDVVRQRIAILNQRGYVAAFFQQSATASVNIATLIMVRRSDGEPSSEKRQNHE